MYLKAGLFAAGLAVGFLVNGWRLGYEIEQIQHQATEREKAAIQSAADESLRLQKVKDEALTNAQIVASKNRAAADGAKSELDRLRDQIARGRGEANNSCTSPAYVETLSDVFGECSTELVEMARTADDLAANAQLIFEAWPK